MADNNTEWQTVNNVRRKKKAPVKYDTKECVEGSKGLKMGKEHRMWHMYIGNLDQFIKTDDVCDYLKENDVKVFMCASLSEGLGMKDQRLFT